MQGHLLALHFGARRLRLRMTKASHSAFLWCNGMVAGIEAVRTVLPLRASTRNSAEGFLPLNGMLRRPDICWL